MGVFAEIASGAVANVVVADAAAHLDSAKTWVQIDGLSPTPGIGWRATESAGTWSFTDPTPAAPPPTLAQQAGRMIASGCQISSTSTPALNGTYAADPVSQQHIAAEIVSIMLNGTFTDGTTTIEWLDVSGATHAFTIAEFKSFATAHAGFVTACLKVINGQSTTLPAQPSVIA